ncbi:hypothetical protein OG21DRAFT_1579942 [Imleria badia]|nr:hypothetical protein OG21DRAFT_1579942 [Imleria badia]
MRIPTSLVFTLCLNFSAAAVIPNVITPRDQGHTGAWLLLVAMWWTDWWLFLTKYEAPRGGISLQDLRITMARICTFVVVLLSKRWKQNTTSASDGSNPSTVRNEREAHPVSSTKHCTTIPAPSNLDTHTYPNDKLAPLRQHAESTFKTSLIIIFAAAAAATSNAGDITSRDNAGSQSNAGASVRANEDSNNLVNALKEVPKDPAAALDVLSYTGETVANGAAFV